MNSIRHILLEHQKGSFLKKHQHKSPSKKFIIDQTSADLSVTFFSPWQTNRFSRTCFKYGGLRFEGKFEKSSVLKRT